MPFKQTLALTFCLTILVLYAWRNQTPLGPPIINQETSHADNGRGITVAVVDSGANLSIGNLRQRVILEHNVIANNQDVSDELDHGTGIANLIADRAKQARLLIIKVIDSSAKESRYLADGIREAADHGAQIINVSLSFDKEDLNLENAVKYAQSKGALVVAAAGNEKGNYPSYPARFENVVVATAIDNQNKVWRAANRGNRMFFGVPAININVYDSSGQYVKRTGTSIASAIITSELAILKEYSKSMNNSGLLKTLEDSSKPASNSDNVLIPDLTKAIDKVANRHRLHECWHRTIYLYLGGIACTKTVC